MVEEDSMKWSFEESRRPWSSDIPGLQQENASFNGSNRTLFSEGTDSLEFSVVTEWNEGGVKLTAPKKCSICIRFTESARPILDVTTDTVDVIEIELEKKRAFLDTRSGSARVFLQSW